MSLPLTNPVGFPMALRTDLSNVTLGQPAGQPVQQAPVDLSQASAPPPSPVAPTVVQPPPEVTPPPTVAAQPTNKKQATEDADLINEAHKSAIDDIRKKYTDPENPNPNISDEDMKDLIDHSQQLALQSTPLERTKKTAGIAANEAAKWAGGTIGLGPTGGPGLWKNLSDVGDWIGNTFNTAETNTNAQNMRAAIAAGAGLMPGAIGAVNSLGTGIRGAWNLADSAVQNHTDQAMKQGEWDAHDIAGQIQREAALNKSLNDQFGGAQKTGEPSMATQLQGPLKAGESVGGIIPFAAGGMVGKIPAVVDALNAVSTGAVNLANVGAGKVLQGIGAASSNPLYRGIATALTGGGLGHVVTGAMAGAAEASPLANILPGVGYMKGAINSALDTVSDAVSTAGDILSNSPGKGTMNSARQVLQDKIDNLDGFVDAANAFPEGNNFLNKYRIGLAGSQRDAYQGILNAIGAGSTGTVDDDFITNQLKNLAHLGGSTLTGTAAGVLLGAGSIMPGDEDSVRQMVDMGMPMSAIGGLFNRRVDRMAQTAQDLEDRGASYKRSDPNITQLHDPAFDALPPNLQSEINRWQGALGRSTDIYVLPANQFADPSIGGVTDGRNIAFQKIAGEKRRIVINADSASDPDTFINDLQHQGGVAVDDTLQTQSPQIRNQMIQALKSAYTPQQVNAFTDNYLAGLPEYGGNIPQARAGLTAQLAAQGVKFDDHIRTQMAAQHYSALTSGSSLQDIFTDPNILAKTASKIKDVLKDIPVIGPLIDATDRATKVNGETQKMAWGDLPVANEGIQLARQGFQSFFNDTRRVNNPRVGARGVQPQGQPQPPEGGVDLGSIPKPASTLDFNQQLQKDKALGQANIINMQLRQDLRNAAAGNSTPPSNIPPVQSIPEGTPTRPGIPFQFAKDPNYRVAQSNVVKVLSDLGFTDEASHISDVGLYHGIGDIYPGLQDKALSYKAGSTVEEAMDKYSRGDNMTPREKAILAHEVALNAGANFGKEFNPMYPGDKAVVQPINHLPQPGEPMTGNIVTVPTPPSTPVNLSSINPTPVTPKSLPFPEGSRPSPTTNEPTPEEIQEGLGLRPDEGRPNLNPPAAPVDVTVGQPVVSRGLDPTNPEHAAALAKLLPHQLGVYNKAMEAAPKNQMISVPYASAMEGKEVTNTDRNKAFENSPASGRIGDVHQPNDINFVPKGADVLKDGTVALSGVNVDSVVHNVNQVMNSDAVKNGSYKPPYTGASDPKLAADLKTYNVNPDALKAPQRHFISTVTNRKTATRNSALGTLEKHGLDPADIHPTFIRKGIRMDNVLPQPANQSMKIQTPEDIKAVQNLKDSFAQANVDEEQPSEKPDLSEVT